MLRRHILAALLLPVSVSAQQPVKHDTLHQHRDTLSSPHYTLPAITITAASTHAAAASTATKVSAAELAHAIATSNGPWDLLRQTAGLEVHIEGQGPGYASHAALRGFSSDHSTDLALWIDGVPINEPINGEAEGYSDWSLLFPEAISNLEVIKGPTSPLFGNFALAGVVNVRTTSKMDGTRAWLQGGSNTNYSATALSGFDHEKSGGVVGARVAHDNGWRLNSDSDLGHLYGGYVAELGAHASIDAGVNIYGARWRSPGFITTDQFDARDFDIVAGPTDRGFKRRAQERVSLRVLSGSSFLWRSTIYATQGRWQFFITRPPEGRFTEGRESRQTEDEDHRYGFGFTSAATWILPRTEITIGTQNRFDHADYEKWFTTARTRDSAAAQISAHQTSGSLFIASSTELGRRLRLDAGGRYDVLGTHAQPKGGVQTSGSKGVVSPKVGMLYHMPRTFSIYANASRGFRQTDGVLFDPLLPFITEWAYETGVKADAHRVNATISLFRADVSNEQTFNAITLETTSGGASRRTGVDVALQAQLSDNVSLVTSWTIVDAKYSDVLTEDGASLAGRPIFNTSKYVGAGTLTIGSASGLLVRAGANAVGPYTPFDEIGVELPAYALFHLSAEKQLGRLLVGAGIRNVLGQHYAEFRASELVSPGQSRSLNITASVGM